MKKLLIYLLPLALLASCAPKIQLYSWADYEKTSYNYLKNANEESTQKLIATYDKIIKKQVGTRKTVPPGIMADYGFLLINQGKVEEGKAMLAKEIKTYPESKIFIERILKMIEE